MVEKKSGLIPVGKITTVFGIKGWVKIHSDTQPKENIFKYDPLWLKTRHGVKVFECDQFQPHGNGLIAHLKGVDDRNAAEQLAGVEIAIDRQQLEPLDSGEYYWSQLIGLRVTTHFDDQSKDLGIVKRIVETGANDVLVVVGDQQSIDTRERLIPYVPEQFIVEVNLDSGNILVDWDSEF